MVTIKRQGMSFAVISRATASSRSAAAGTGATTCSLPPTTPTYHATTLAIWTSWKIASSSRRTSGRNYYAANSYAFQGLREADDQGLIPFALPLLDVELSSDPMIFGSRFFLDSSFLALNRTDGLDTRRLLDHRRLGAALARPVLAINTASASVFAATTTISMAIPTPCRMMGDAPKRD